MMMMNDDENNIKTEGRVTAGVTYDLDVRGFNPGTRKSFFFTRRLFPKWGRGISAVEE